MYMTEADICQEYRQAKDKQAQIGILADLVRISEGQKEAAGNEAEQ